MSTILQFPKEKIFRNLVPDPEILARAQARATESFAQLSLNDIGEILYENLETCGVDTRSPTFNKDFSFVMEALKALIHRDLELDHHLHNFIDSNVEIEIIPTNNESLKEEIQGFVET